VTRAALRSLAVLTLIALAACADSAPTGTSQPTTTTGDTPVSSTTTATTAPPGTTTIRPPEPEGAIVGVQPADGNRVVSGSGRVPAVSPIDVPLPGIPAWVVGVTDGEAAGWVVALENGETVTVAWRSGQAVVETTPLRLAPLQPPRAIATSQGPLPVAPVHPTGSPTTEGLTVGEDSWHVTGDTRLWANLDGADSLVTEGVLTDTRLVASQTGLLALLTDPTDRYPHGVLGDIVEAGGFAVVDRDTATRFTLPEPTVIEGLSPMWVDADGDGVEEILVTLADREGGARLALFDAGGTLISEGPSFDQGFRWRHQIGAAPLGPNGEYEIVSVATPHLGGVVEFSRLGEGTLELVASVPGLTSHVLGSRVIDLALIADADGDGLLEVVAPTQDLTEIGAARRTADGAEIAWVVPMGGRLCTNLFAVDVAGSLWMAGGRDDGVLRIWPGR